MSPWYWFADVPVRHRADLFVLPGAHSQGEPAVKYRGIFLNDEAPALSGWTREKFGGVNHQFYEHVFELILRLKGNYLWPAMWGNAFNDDDKTPRWPTNTASSWARRITSRCCAQQEWKRYGKASGTTTQRLTLRVLTQASNMGSHESIVTVECAATATCR